MTFRIVALRDDTRWIAAKWIRTLEDAERLQRRLYVSNPGTDFVIEEES